MRPLRLAGCALALLLPAACGPAPSLQPAAPPPVPLPPPPAASSAAEPTPPAPGAGPERTRDAAGIAELAAGTRVPIPAGWHETPWPDGLHLVGPERDVTLDLVEVRGARDAADALARAVEARKADEFKSPQKMTKTSSSATEWLDESYYGSYPEGDGGRQRRALILRKGDMTLVALFAGTGGALERRGANLNEMLGGAKLPGATQLDLATKTAKTFDEAMGKELAAFVDKALAQAKAPGLALAVVQGGKIVFARGWGVREAGKKDAVTPDTRFLIGSTTKSMSALLAGVTIEKGLASWDTRATKLEPTFKVDDAKLTERLTFADFFCACTGMPRNDLELIFEFAGATPESSIKSLARIKPTTPYGETFQYSNQMVSVGGYLAARLLSPKKPIGAAYDEAMQQYVFGPAGMKSTTTDPARGRRAEGRASPHAVDLENELRPVPLSLENFVDPLRPAGGAWSTANDLGRYLLVQIGRGTPPDGKPLVKKETVEETWSPRVKTSDDEHYALGWSVGKNRGLREIEHSGSTIGFRSFLDFFPDQGFGIAIVTNGSAPQGRIAQRLLELLYDLPPRAEAGMKRVFEREAEQVAEIKKKLDPKPDAKLLDPLLGTYTHPTLGTIRLAKKGADYTLDAGEWSSRLATKTEDGKQRIVLRDLPLAGLELRVEEGKPVLSFGQQTYRWERK